MMREKKTTADNSSHLAPAVQSGKVTGETEEMEQKKNKLRKRVAGLMKKQKRRQAMGIVRGQDYWKPWGQEAQVKVCDACTCKLYLRTWKVYSVCITMYLLYVPGWLSID